ncbi:MAG: hypothetical protein ISR86_09975 [Nitrospinaceae bacterium]|nr:hypothetical protein [Nitrospinaceae bacterium]
MLKLFLSCTLFFLFHVPLLESSPLFDAKSLKCSFESGVFTKFENEKWKSKNSKMVDLIFDGINTDKQSARLIANAGTSDLSALLTPRALHLIEITGTGNYNLTSVFLPNQPAQKSISANEPFLAVHSRHLNIPDPINPVFPLVSQYYGKCLKWDVDR